SGWRAAQISFNAAIDACAKGGRWEQALDLLEEMVKHRLFPSLVSYNSAMDACAKEGRHDGDLEIYCFLLLKGLAAPLPDAVSFNTCINACGKGRKPELARGLLSRMRACGVKPDVVTYNALLSVEGIRDEDGEGWQRALALLEEMKRDGLPLNRV
ncbi:unnamed protein product, partial [Choristocarpus tenellus]